MRKKIFKKIRKRLPERIPHSRHGLHPTKDYSTLLHTLHSLMFPSENFARVEINQIDFVCLIIFERFAFCISLMKRKERRRRRSLFLNNLCFPPSSVDGRNENEINKRGRLLTHYRLFPFCKKHFPNVFLNRESIRERTQPTGCFPLFRRRLVF